MTVKTSLPHQQLTPISVALSLFWQKLTIGVQRQDLLPVCIDHELSLASYGEWKWNIGANISGFICTLNVVLFVAISKKLH